MSHKSHNHIHQLAPFDLQSRTRLVFGLGSVERIGELALGLGASRVLLVTDPGIVSAGHATRVIKLLEHAGIAVSCFDAVRENPGTRCVDKCVEVARDSGIDTIVALGGGSSMDTAKGCNFIFSNGGRMSDYWGIGKAIKPMLPLIAVPTTGGTGSECQSFALISDELTHQKMACGDPKAAARIAILDPALTVSQPARVTACTGIDAIAHAIETAVTVRRNPVSTIFSREAFRLAVHALPRVISSPGDLDARGAMLLAAAWAGTAIENSMLGAAHSAANPLTAHLGITHGHAVGIMLPHVIRFNSEHPEAAREYAELARALPISAFADSSSDGAGFLAQTVESLMDCVGLARSLRKFGAREQEISVLADEAARQWTARFNPRPVLAGDFEKLYAAALDSGHAAVDTDKSTALSSRAKERPAAINAAGQKTGTNP